MQNNSPKKSLTDVMGDVINNSASEVETEQDASVDEGLAELEKTEIFKSLPQDQKDLIRSKGAIVSPDVEEIDQALAANEEEFTEEINRIRELEGKEEISVDEFKSNSLESIDEEDDDQDELEADFKKMFGEVDGSDDEEESLSDEERKDRDLRDFERKLQEALTVEFDDDEEVDTESAALDFKIQRNKEYEENVKSVLTDNNIKFKSKKKGLKKGLLKSFMQRKTHVTTPLINSGIFITLSGASIPEIIQMNTIEGKNRSEIEMKKLGYIQKHLVNSSVGGKISLHQLTKLIHYKDIQTLYFNLFVASFPDENEYPMTCENEKCGADLKLKVNATDMVLNPEEFEKTSDYILNEQTNITDMLNNTPLSKEKQAMIGLVVAGLRSPTVYDVMLLTRRIEELQSKMPNLDDYMRVLGYLTFITYMALPDEDGDYVQYTELDDILEILSSMDEDQLDELDQLVEEYTTVNVVKYGFKDYTCPSCGRLHKETELDISDFLYTLSQYLWTVKEVEKMNRKSGMKNSSDVKLLMNE